MAQKLEGCKRLTMCAFRLDTIPERNGQTHRQKDGIGKRILRSSCITCWLTRDKKRTKLDGYERQEIAAEDRSGEN